jgi:cellulose synthase/poly-beta-1,6-N-acetylglucosamine synthase-like glycosyltransferase
VLRYWILAAPAILLALISLRGARQRARYVARRLAQQPAVLPAACVIVPVKGEDEGLRENLAALASLDYPDYELVVVARTASDIPPGVLPRRATIVLAHGEDPQAGEKVQNLEGAIRAAGKCAQVYAFADSDGRVTPQWLRALVAPLEEPEVGASTGFRWFAPEPSGFWPLLRSVWDAAVLECLPPAGAAFAWGGSMAIRKETFFEIGVLGAWKNAVSDDYALSAAVRRAGLRIAYAPGALVPSRERLSAVQFLKWARRQMLLTRVYRPGLWCQALAVYTVYCVGMAVSALAAIQGYRLAALGLIAQLAPGMWKGLHRATLARAALPEYALWFKRHLWAHAIWTPLATWLWLIVLFASGFGHTIQWRGYTYDLNADTEPRR